MEKSRFNRCGTAFPKARWARFLVGVTLVGCASTPKAPPPPEPPRFTSEANWTHAGYNNDEIVYTILITSQDTRILKCTTRMQGAYFNNGQKSSIADQQLSTVFPGQQVQAGIWLDMDQASGATYEVKCKPAG